ncbi:MAG: DNA methyltransferase [bacterium]|nr:DNA methyltransferase [bacterium]
MPLFTWIGKDKVVNHDKDVPFRLLKKNKGLSLGERSENLIVEGDNLEALKALLPFYYGQVKCVYIDPPYNTGNEKWVYNDKVNSPAIQKWLKKTVGQEGEDLERHDKWLCMMYPRLKLLHQLLREDGVIFISIDDNEHCNLKMIMDDIFGTENFVANIIWQKKFSPQNDARYFSDNHDFIVCYAKKKNYNGIEDGWKRNLQPRNDEMNARYSNPDNDTRGVWTSGDMSVKTYTPSTDYPITTPSGRVVNPPKGYCWRFSKEKFTELVKDSRIWFGENGSNVPRLKRFLTEVQEGLVPLTIWLHTEVGHNQEAKQEIKNILKSESPFQTPKPTRLIKRILQIATRKDDIILDSFAGSGTTAQAVLEMNEEEKDSNRKFILVEMEKKIAREITQERVRRVAKKIGGGDFEYVELGEPLFRADGNINDKVSFEEMASYIYFTETLSNIDKKKIKGNCIGEYNGTEYYLLFRQKGENILSRSALKGIKKNEERKVIYADKCLLGEETLGQYNIVFKQIPYQVRVY